MIKSDTIKCLFTEYDWEQFYLREQLGEKLYSRLLGAKNRNKKYYELFLKKHNIKLFDDKTELDAFRQKIKKEIRYQQMKEYDQKPEVKERHRELERRKNRIKYAMRWF